VFCTPAAAFSTLNSVTLSRAKHPSDSEFQTDEYFTGGNRENGVIPTSRSFRAFTKGNEGNEDPSLLTLRPSFSWLSSVQKSEFEPRLISEIIPLLPPLPPVKSDAGLVAAPPRQDLCDEIGLRNFGLAPIGGQIPFPDVHSPALSS
jgi:hypothetical protein